MKGNFLGECEYHAVFDTECAIMKTLLFFFRMRFSRGFTLVEVMLVMAFIGIMTGVVFVSLSTRRSMESAKSAAREVAAAVREKMCIRDSAYLERYPDRACTPYCFGCGREYGLSASDLACRGRGQDGENDELSVRAFLGNSTDRFTDDYDRRRNRKDESCPRQYFALL